jgi:hypothetical protein
VGIPFNLDPNLNINTMEFKIILDSAINFIFRLINNEGQKPSLSSIIANSYNKGVSYKVTFPILTIVGEDLVYVKDVTMNFNEFPKLLHLISLNEAGMEYHRALYKLLRRFFQVFFSSRIVDECDAWTEEQKTFVIVPQLCCTSDVSSSMLTFKGKNDFIYFDIKEIYNIFDILNDDSDISFSYNQGGDVDVELALKLKNAGSAICNLEKKAKETEKDVERLRYMNSQMSKEVDELMERLKKAEAMSRELANDIEKKDDLIAEFKIQADIKHKEEMQLLHAIIGKLYVEQCKIIKL